MLLIILCANASACGLTDWGYALPNDYAVLSANSYSITIGGPERPAGNSWPIVIENYVTAFCFNERYVGAKQVPIDREKVDLEDFDKAVKTGETVYYIVDTETQQVYGPWATEEEYLQKCTDLQITGLCDWISTKRINVGNVDEIVPTFPD